MRQLVIIFWAFVFGEVLGYIGGALDTMTYHPLQIGIIAAICALITSNAINLLGQPTKKKS